MENTEENKNTEKISLDELKTFIDKRYTPEPVEEKPEKMNNEEMENFFNSRVIPVYEKILKQFAEHLAWNSTTKFTLHSRVATFIVVEDLSLFYFKVDIDNIKRQFRIIYGLSYRKGKNKKLCKTKTIETINISFRDIDTINEELLITLFSKWYMNKDELIQKYIEKTA